MKEIAQTTKAFQKNGMNMDILIGHPNDHDHSSLLNHTAYYRIPESLRLVDAENKRILNCFGKLYIRLYPQGKAQIS